MKKSLVIGLFIDSYYPIIDGVITVVNQTASRLSKTHQVIVVAPFQKNSTDHLFNYQVLRVKSIKVPFTDYRLSIPFLDFRVQKKLDIIPFDIIHIHSPFALGNLGIKTAKKRKIPLVSTIHSQFKKDFYERTHSKTLTKLALAKILKRFEQCDRIYAVNEGMRSLFTSEYGLKKPIHLLNNATDLTPNENHLMPEYKTIKALLYVGRIDRIKNLFFILDVLQILKDEGFNFQMTFIGEGVDKHVLINKSKKLGLENHVVFKGKLGDRHLLKDAYSNAHLFIFPSLYDASSLVQIEAASQSLPTLFINGAITSEGIIDGFNGYLSPNDTNKYAQKIMTIFNDLDIYQNVRKNTQRTLYQSWEKTLKRLEADYHSLIQDNERKSL